MPSASENYYWLFSSSAQTISAFVAFLITGYALVLNMMQNLEQKDDTYEEVNHQLKKDYYNKLIILAVITGLAILSSLWMVYLNGIKFSHKSWLFPLTAFLNVLAIIVGIIFVLSIINPNKYKIAAKEIIKEDKNKESKSDSTVDQTIFMVEFIKLEKNIRDILQAKQLYVPYGNIPKMVYSFRQMAEALSQNELIGYYDFLELLKINKYRNLVFHGHLDKVDADMLGKIEKANDIINHIK
jgi:hypothetical protein